MTGDAEILMTVASAGIVAVAIVSTALLRGWKDYLAMKRLELEQPGGSPRPYPAAAARELRELKERVRKLEAIANGVDS